MGPAQESGLWMTVGSVLCVHALVAVAVSAARQRTIRTSLGQLKLLQGLVDAAINNDLAALSIALLQRPVHVVELIQKQHSRTEFDETESNDFISSDDDGSNSNTDKFADPVASLALVLAAQAGHEQVVEMLLRAGVSPHPLHKQWNINEINLGSKSQDEKQQLDIYAANLFSWSPVIAAARSCEPRVLRLLLEWGADPNCSTSTSANDDNTTALMYAAAAGSMPCVSVLLEFGADATSTNAEGSATWQFAESRGFNGLAGLLMHEAAAMDAERHAHRDASAVKATRARAKMESNMRHRNAEAQRDLLRQVEEALGKFRRTFRKSASGQLEALSVGCFTSFNTATFHQVIHQMQDCGHWLVQSNPALFQNPCTTHSPSIASLSTTAFIETSATQQQQPAQEILPIATLLRRRITRGLNASLRLFPLAAKTAISSPSLAATSAAATTLVRRGLSESGSQLESDEPISKESVVQLAARILNSRTEMSPEALTRECKLLTIEICQPDRRFVGSRCRNNTDTDEPDQLHGPRQLLRCLGDEAFSVEESCKGTTGRLNTQRFTSNVLCLSHGMWNALADLMVVACKLCDDRTEDGEADVVNSMLVLVRLHLDAMGNMCMDPLSVDPGGKEGLTRLAELLVGLVMSPTSTLPSTTPMQRDNDTGRTPIAHELAYDTRVLAVELIAQHHMLLLCPAHGHVRLLNHLWSAAPPPRPVDLAQADHRDYDTDSDNTDDDFADSTCNEYQTLVLEELLRTRLVECIKHVGGLCSALSIRPKCSNHFEEEENKSDCNKAAANAATVLLRGANPDGLSQSLHTLDTSFSPDLDANAATGGEGGLRVKQAPHKRRYVPIDARRKLMAELTGDACGEEEKSEKYGDSSDDGSWVAGVSSLLLEEAQHGNVPEFAQALDAMDAVASVDCTCIHDSPCIGSISEDYEASADIEFDWSLLNTVVRLAMLGDGPSDLLLCGLQDELLGQAALSHTNSSDATTATTNASSCAATQQRHHIDLLLQYCKVIFCRTELWLREVSALPAVAVSTPVVSVTAHTPLLRTGSSNSQSSIVGMNSSSTGMAGVIAPSRSATSSGSSIARPFVIVKQNDNNPEYVGIESDTSSSGSDSVGFDCDYHYTSRNGSGINHGEREQGLTADTRVLQHQQQRERQRCRIRAKTNQNKKQHTQRIFRFVSHLLLGLSVIPPNNTACHILSKDLLMVHGAASHVKASLAAAAEPNASAAARSFVSRQNTTFMPQQVVNISNSVVVALCFVAQKLMTAVMVSNDELASRPTSGRSRATTSASDISDSSTGGDGGGSFGTDTETETDLFSPGDNHSRLSRTRTVSSVLSLPAEGAGKTDGFQNGGGTNELEDEDVEDIGAHVAAMERLLKGAMFQYVHHPSESDVGAEQETFVRELADGVSNSAAMALHDFISNQPQMAVHRVSFGSMERDRLCDTAVRTAAGAYLKHMGCVKDAMRAGREIQVGFGGPIHHQNSQLRKGDKISSRVRSSGDSLGAIHPDVRKVWSTAWEIRSKLFATHRNSRRKVCSVAQCTSEVVLSDSDWRCEHGHVSLTYIVKDSPGLVERLARHVTHRAQVLLDQRSLFADEANPWTPRRLNTQTLSLSQPRLPMSPSGGKTTPVPSGRPSPRSSFARNTKQKQKQQQQQQQQQPQVQPHRQQNQHSSLKALVSQAWNLQPKQSPVLDDADTFVKSALNDDIRTAQLEAYLRRKNQLAQWRYRGFEVFETLLRDSTFVSGTPVHDTLHSNGSPSAAKPKAGGVLAPIQSQYVLTAFVQSYRRMPRSPNADDPNGRGRHHLDWLRPSRACYSVNERAYNVVGFLLDTLRDHGVNLPKPTLMSILVILNSMQLNLADHASLDRVKVVPLLAKILNQVEAEDPSKAMPMLWTAPVSPQSLGSPPRWSGAEAVSPTTDEGSPHLGRFGGSSSNLSGWMEQGGQGGGGEGIAGQHMNEDEELHDDVRKDEGQEEKVKEEEEEVDKFDSDFPHNFKLVCSGPRQQEVMARICKLDFVSSRVWAALSSIILQVFMHARSNWDVLIDARANTSDIGGRGVQNGTTKFVGMMDATCSSSRGVRPQGMGRPRSWTTTGVASDTGRSNDGSNADGHTGWYESSQMPSKVTPLHNSTLRLVIRRMRECFTISARFQREQTLTQQRPSDYPTTSAAAVEGLEEEEEEDDDDNGIVELWRYAINERQCFRWLSLLSTLCFNKTVTEWVAHVIAERSNAYHSTSPNEKPQQHMLIALIVHGSPRVSLHAMRFAQRVLPYSLSLMTADVVQLLFNTVGAWAMRNDVVGRGEVNQNLAQEGAKLLKALAIFDGGKSCFNSLIVQECQANMKAFHAMVNGTPSSPGTTHNNNKTNSSGDLFEQKVSMASQTPDVSHRGPLAKQQQQQQQQQQSDRKSGPSITSTPAAAPSRVRPRSLSLSLTLSTSSPPYIATSSFPPAGPLASGKSVGGRGASHKVRGGQIRQKPAVRHSIPHTREDESKLVVVRMWATLAVMDQLQPSPMAIGARVQVASSKHAGYSVDYGTLVRLATAQAPFYSVLLDSVAVAQPQYFPQENVSTIFLPASLVSETNNNATTLEGSTNGSASKRTMTDAIGKIAVDVFEMLLSKFAWVEQRVLDSHNDAIELTSSSSTGRAHQRSNRGRHSNSKRGRELHEPRGLAPSRQPRTSISTRLRKAGINGMVWELLTEQMMAALHTWIALSPDAVAVIVQKRPLIWRHLVEICSSPTPSTTALALKDNYSSMTLSVVVQLRSAMQDLRAAGFVSMSLHSARHFSTHRHHVGGNLTGISNKHLPQKQQHHRGHQVDDALLGELPGAWWLNDPEIIDNHSSSSTSHNMQSGSSPVRFLGIKGAPLPPQPFARTSIRRLDKNNTSSAKSGAAKATHGGIGKNAGSKVTNKGRRASLLAAPELSQDSRSLLAKQESSRMFREWSEGGDLHLSAGLVTPPPPPPPLPFPHSIISSIAAVSEIHTAAAADDNSAVAADREIKRTAKSKAQIPDTDTHILERRRIVGELDDNDSGTSSSDDMQVADLKYHSTPHSHLVDVAPPRTTSPAMHSGSSHPGDIDLTNAAAALEEVAAMRMMDAGMSAGGPGSIGATTTGVDESQGGGGSASVSDVDQHSARVYPFVEHDRTVVADWCSDAPDALVAELMLEHERRQRMVDQQRLRMQTLRRMSCAPPTSDHTNMTNGSSKFPSPDRLSRGFRSSLSLSSIGGGWESPSFGGGIGCGSSVGGGSVGGGGSVTGGGGFDLDLDPLEMSGLPYFLGSGEEDSVSITRLASHHSLTNISVASDISPSTGRQQQNNPLPPPIPMVPTVDSVSIRPVSSPPSSTPSRQQRFVEPTPIRGIGSGDSTGWSPPCSPPGSPGSPAWAVYPSPPPPPTPPVHMSNSTPREGLPPRSPAPPQALSSVSPGPVSPQRLPRRSLGGGTGSIGTSRSARLHKHGSAQDLLSWDVLSGSRSQPPRSVDGGSKFGVATKYDKGFGLGTAVVVVTGNNNPQSSMSGITAGVVMDEKNGRVLVQEVRALTGLSFTHWCDADDVELAVDVFSDRFGIYLPTSTSGTSPSSRPTSAASTDILFGKSSEEDEEELRARHVRDRSVVTRLREELNHVVRRGTILQARSGALAALESALRMSDTNLHPFQGWPSAEKSAKTHKNTPNTNKMDNKIDLNVDANVGKMRVGEQVTHQRHRKQERASRLRANLRNGPGMAVDGDTPQSQPPTRGISSGGDDVNRDDSDGYDEDDEGDADDFEDTDDPRHVRLSFSSSSSTSSPRADHNNQSVFQLAAQQVGDPGQLIAMLKLCHNSVMCSYSFQTASDASVWSAMVKLFRLDDACADLILNECVLCLSVVSREVILFESPHPLGMAVPDNQVQNEKMKGERMNGSKRLSIAGTSGLLVEFDRRSAILAGSVQVTLSYDRQGKETIRVIDGKGVDPWRPVVVSGDSVFVHWATDTQAFEEEFNLLNKSVAPEYHAAMLWGFSVRVQSLGDGISGDEKLVLARPLGGWHLLKVLASAPHRVLELGDSGRQLVHTMVSYLRCPLAPWKAQVCEMLIQVEQTLLPHASLSIDMDDGERSKSESNVIFPHVTRHMLHGTTDTGSGADEMTLWTRLLSYGFRSIHYNLQVLYFIVQRSEFAHVPPYFQCLMELAVVWRKYARTPHPSFGFGDMERLDAEDNNGSDIGAPRMTQVEWGTRTCSILTYSFHAQPLDVELNLSCETCGVVVCLACAHCCHATHTISSLPLPYQTCQCTLINPDSCKALVVPDDYWSVSARPRTWFDEVCRVAEVIDCVENSRPIPRLFLQESIHASSDVRLLFLALGTLEISLEQTAQLYWWTSDVRTLWAQLLSSGYDSVLEVAFGLFVLEKSLCAESFRDGWFWEIDDGGDQCDSNRSDGHDNGDNSSSNNNNNSNNSNSNSNSNKNTSDPLPKLTKREAWMMQVCSGDVRLVAGAMLTLAAALVNTACNPQRWDNRRKDNWVNMLTGISTSHTSVTNSSYVAFADVCLANFTQLMEMITWGTRVHGEIRKPRVTATRVHTAGESEESAEDQVNVNTDSHHVNVDVSNVTESTDTHVIMSDVGLTDARVLSAMLNLPFKTLMNANSHDSKTFNTRSPSSSLPASRQPSPSVVASTLSLLNVRPRNSVLCVGCTLDNGMSTLWSSYLSGRSMCDDSTDETDSQSDGVVHGISIDATRLKQLAAVFEHEATGCINGNGEVAPLVDCVDNVQVSLIHGNIESVLDSRSLPHDGSATGASNQTSPSRAQQRLQGTTESGNPVGGGSVARASVAVNDVSTDHKTHNSLSDVHSLLSTYDRIICLGHCSTYLESKLSTLLTPGGVFVYPTTLENNKKTADSSNIRGGIAGASTGAGTNTTAEEKTKMHKSKFKIQQPKMMMIVRSAFSLELERQCVPLGVNNKATPNSRWNPLPMDELLSRSRWDSSHAVWQDVILSRPARHTQSCVVNDNMTISSSALWDVQKWVALAEAVNEMTASGREYDLLAPRDLSGDAKSNEDGKTRKRTVALLADSHPALNGVSVLDLESHYGVLKHLNKCLGQVLLLVDLTPSFSARASEHMNKVDTSSSQRGGLGAQLTRLKHMIFLGVKLNVWQSAMAPMRSPSAVEFAPSVTVVRHANEHANLHLNNVGAPRRSFPEEEEVEDTESNVNDRPITPPPPSQLSSEQYPDWSLVLQTFHQLRQIPMERLCRYDQAFTVRYAGEGGHDLGGLFRDLFAELSEELSSGVVDLFVSPPDAKAQSSVVTNRTSLSASNNSIGGALLPRPSARSALELELYTFIGSLMGIAAMKLGALVSLDFSPLIMKLLVNDALNVNDLEWIDQRALKTVKFIRTALSNSDQQAQEVDFAYVFADTTFTTTWIDGGHMIPRSLQMREEDIVQGDVSGVDDVSRTRRGSSRGSLGIGVNEVKKKKEKEKEIRSGVGVVGANTDDASAADSLQVAELCRMGKSRRVTVQNGLDYARLLSEFRLQECNPQIKAMFRGMAALVPARLLPMFTHKELQQLICGVADEDMDMLEAQTVYVGGVHATDRHVELFWSVLKDDFSPDERSAFLRFVSGQERLSLVGGGGYDGSGNGLEGAMVLKIGPHIQSENASSKRNDINGSIVECDGSGRERGIDTTLDDWLPVAHTCFFSLDLPRYSCREAMSSKLRFAMRNCQAIDADNTNVGQANINIMGMAFLDD